MIVNKSFMMVKTISYALNDIKYQVDCLEQLKQCKFNRIIIPNFSYGVFENVLTIHMEYIKGQQIYPNKKKSYTDIVYEDLVCSTNPISAKGYALENFIITGDKIYYIDLEDMAFCSIEDRKIKFEKDWVNRK